MYNSQYYTCEQIDERLLQGYLDDYNSQTGQSLTKAQFLTKLGSIFSKEGTIDNTLTQIGYYECDTAAGTAAKVITVANYSLFAGGSMKVKFVNKNTANNATLNINSQGAKALYYNGVRVSSTNTWDAGEVVEIYYDGTSYYANNVKGSTGDGVFDISVYNPTEGQPTPYADLASALGPNGQNVPVQYRKGGMSVKFVLSSDNKYVQARCMAQNFTTDVTQWQGVDDEPTAGSDNLVKSGGVLDSIVNAVNSEKERAEASEQHLQESVDSVKEETLEENREMVNSVMENYAPIEITGDVNNAADEEDLTSINIEGTDVLKFKDKAYNPLVYSGLGRKILRKNIVNGVNTLTQEMMSDANTIYVIQYDFTLGENITVPANCVLEFEGGGLSNSSLIGNNTTIVNDSNGKIFSEITFSGTYWQDYICSDWFEYEEFYKMFDAISVLATSDIITNIVIKQMTVTYDGPVRGSYLGEKTGYLFDVPSNTDIDFCSSVLTLAPNDISFFYVLNISNKNNVKVRNITVVGDIEGHIPTQYNEFIHGICVTSSSNVELDNCKGNNFWGDGICVTKEQTKSNHCVNVTVKNSIFDSNRRQGCSISEGENIYFENCEFLNTGTIAGTSPDAGVDIEPNGAGAVIKNIVFSKCKFLGNEGTYGGVLIMTIRLTEDVDAEDIKFINCDIDGIHHYGKGGCHLESCVISNSKNRSNCLNFSKNAIIKDCIITFAKNNLVSKPNDGILVTGNSFTADYNYNSFEERHYNRCFTATFGTINGVNKVIILTFNKLFLNYGGVDVELASNTEGIKGVYKVRYAYNGEKLVKVYENNYDLQFRQENPISIAVGCTESVEDGNYLKLCIARDGNNSIDVYGVIRSICGGIVLNGIPVSVMTWPGGYNLSKRMVPYVYSGSSLPNYIGGGMTLKGDMFFDDADGINSPAFYDGTKWVDANGIKVLCKRGTVAQRPNDADVKNELGFKYYDEQNNRELIWNGATWMTNDGELVLYKYKSEPLSAFTSQRYINTNVAVGTVVDLTEVYGNYDCKVIELNAEDVVALKGIGGSAPRMWALIDAENKLISNFRSMAASANIPLKTWVKAPSACKMVINFFNVNASPKYGNYREMEYEVVIYSNTPFA